MDLNSVSNGKDSVGERQALSSPIIERVPLPMVEVEGPEHLICSVNAAFCSLLQKKQADLLGKRFSEIVRNGPRCIPLLDRVYQTGEFETHVDSDDAETDSTFWLYAMWPTLNVEKKPSGVVIQLTKAPESHKHLAGMNEALLLGALREHELRDKSETANTKLQLEIAERQRIEEVLAIAQLKLRADADQLEQTVAARTIQLRTSVEDLEAFNYSLVHDLRAPLRAIHSFTQLALELSSENGGHTPVDLLRRVIKASIRMDSLIQDVLSLSQVIRRPISIRPIEVDTLVRTLVEERPEFSTAAAEIVIKSPLLPMLGHEALLSQCLTNLLSNAVKFVEPGVKAHVNIRSEELSFPATRAIPATESVPSSEPPPIQLKVRLWIEDQGIGMDPENYETIFQIFQRLHPASKYEGTGIGLAIVRKAIERMGGHVGVESESGKGSRFWLELPKG